MYVCMCVWVGAWVVWCMGVNISLSGDGGDGCKILFLWIISN